MFIQTYLNGFSIRQTGDNDFEVRLFGIKIDSFSSLNAARMFVHA